MQMLKAHLLTTGKSRWFCAMLDYREKAPLCKGCARRRVQSATAQRAALSAELSWQKSLIFD